MGVTSQGKPKDRLHYRYPISAKGVLGELFQKALEDGHTIRDLSKRVGVSKNTMTCWRQGKLTPSYFMLGCLADALGYEMTLKEKPNVSSNS